MKKIKKFFSKLRQNDVGENIVVREEPLKKNFPGPAMNENIKKYNRLLEEIESVRREIKLLMSAFSKVSEEFIMFVSIPKERENEDQENPDAAKKQNPYLNDFMLRRNEFEEKTRRFKEAFDKIAELRKKEMNKYFEAKRLINGNSIIIGEKSEEIEIFDPGENIDEINMSNDKNSVIINTDKEKRRGGDDLQ